MNSIEIRDEEIDVEEIMHKIRENIKKRTDSGVYPQQMKDLIDKPLQAVEAGESGIGNLQQEIDYLNRNWDTHTEYSISSHRPITGRFLIKGRQLVHGEVRRYVDLIEGKQIEFNANLVRVINGLIQSFDDKYRQVRVDLSGEIDDKVGRVKAELNVVIDDKIDQVKTGVSRAIEDNVEHLKIGMGREIEDRVGQVKAEISGEIDDTVSQVKTEMRSEIDDKVGQVKTEISCVTEDRVGRVKTEISREMDGTIRELIAEINEDIKNKAWLADILERRIKTIEFAHPSRATQESAYINYFVFGDEMAEAWTRISGRSVDTPNIFEESIELFHNSKNILEIGCGKGYFLQLLKENGIGGYGIELNEDFVIYCQRMGLDVQKVDALTHLSALEDKSIDGVFMGQVVEHLHIDVMFPILKLCYKKLQYGSYIVIVTPNILNMVVSTNLFYMDPTHVNHVHPEVIKFLLRSCGFRDIQERFYQPVPDDFKLKKIEIDNQSGTGEQTRFLQILNHNTDMLNNVLFGYRDYAVIAKR